MKKFMHLQLFNEGAGAAAAPGAAQTGSAPQKADKVVYGKQSETDQVANDPPPPPPGVTSNTMNERRAQFEQLIKGEYKDLFAERTQSIIDRRFKETKQLEAQLTSINPVVDMLFSRYDVKSGDYEGLQKAIDNDVAYWEDAADQAGLTVEQFKYIKQMERENESLRQLKEQQEMNQYLNKQYEDWYKQSEIMKASYPDFDLERELEENPNFKSLVLSNVPIQAAYEVVHLDDIKQFTAQTAARTTETNVTKNIQARGNRPTENGITNQSGLIVKNDVTKLTAKDRAEIARRVARGEQIKW